MLWTRQVLTFASRISRVRAWCDGVASCKDKSGAVTWTEFLAAALCVSVCRNRRRVRVRVGRVSLKMLAGDLKNLDCDAIILGLRTI